MKLRSVQKLCHDAIPALCVYGCVCEREKKRAGIIVLIAISLYIYNYIDSKTTNSYIITEF